MTEAASAPASDEGLLARLAQAEPRAVVDWVERDHPIAEFLGAVAISQPEVAGLDEVLRLAWREALASVGPGRPPGALRTDALRTDALRTDALRTDALRTHALRTVVLRAVLGALDDAGRLDVGPIAAPVPGPYLPAGDRWEGWWVDDDAVTALDGRPPRPRVLAALRQLPLGLRVLLVLRDAAGLAAVDAVDLVAGAAGHDQTLLEEARVGFISLLDTDLTGAKA